MGLIKVHVLIKKRHGTKPGKRVAFLVDSGAVYSVAPRDLLEGLGIRPYRKRTFYLANGEEITRELSDAYFEYRGAGGAAPVIFGEPGDRNLLGAKALEAMERVLNPMNRELRPLSMTL